MSEPQDQAKSNRLPAGLYVIATPIGHLKDITARAIETLRGVDALACEDTRVTSKLLSAYDIRVSTFAYHDHNADAVRPQLIERLRAGERIGLVSDAGTPLISDPGFKLVRDCRAAGILVVPIPGPSALLTALAGAGLPTDAFHFSGFLSQKSGARQTELQALATIPATLVLYESNHRLPESLADMAKVLGARDACVARELTKQFEEFRHGTLPELAAHYEKAGSPKGEVVVVIGPPNAPPAEGLSESWQQSIQVLRAAGAPVKAVVEALLPHADISRDALYEFALSCSNNRA